MKRVILLLMLFAGTSFSIAQTTEIVQLEQTKGEFTQKEVKLKAGSYIFEISNNNIGHDVGFVLAPKGKTDQENHIKDAYVTSLVKTNSSSKSKVVTLEPGEYVYFCPLNPTPEYTLIVE